MCQGALASFNISPRLLAAASLVCAGQVAADIGCDHGKLAVWLALAGVCPQVIAVDARPLPLAKAQALAKKSGCAHLVQCRLGQGLLPLQPMEASQIVIAGLSGKSIVDIIMACAWLKTPQLRLILVPTTKHATLRGGLCRGGFAICSETPVLDQKRPYTVIEAKYTGQISQPGELFCHLGLVPATKSQAARAYIEKRLQHLKKMAPSARGQEEINSHTALIMEVEACLL